MSRIWSVVSFLLFPVLAGGDVVNPALYAGLKWREIGPFRGGRSTAVSGVPSRPNEFYMGTTGGGLWKSTNAGVDWVCVSDGFFRVGSIGAIGVSASNPDVVYVGTGETCIRGNISHGDGVYKTLDGGKTWKHVGLQDTQYIARVRVHPTDENTVYVAALGHVYGPNEQRGVFKSTDGGETWHRVLFESNKAGAIDLCLDPSNPEVIYAATWEAWRTPYTLNSGGPGSKLFKSQDGGRTWQDLTGSPGLPRGVLGRIGVAVSPVDSKRVWAMVEALDGGLFKSDDAGVTWQRVNENRNMRQRAWYYTHVYADPKDVDTVYVLNVAFFKSTDGGVTFSTINVPHSDNHDLWVDPSDPKRMINANDGGANVTVDGGRTWTEQDFPTAQFYHVSTDNAFPYNILGAQQDNSTVRIKSRTTGQGITRQDWTSTAGGESGYVVAKPDDPDVVFGGSYGGYLQMLNHRTGETRNVSPWPDNPIGHGAIDLKHRFQWTFPVVFSLHDPNVLYVSSQYLLKTTNGGQTWVQISEDLTRNDPSKLGPSGGPITKDNTSVEYYCTIFSVAESPLQRGVIWTGSDDGLVHITRDNGFTWQNVTPPAMPTWGLVSMVEASPHDAAVAYLAVDNHENDDLRPYIFRTSDFGKTWTRCDKGIPTGSFVRVVREDTIRRGLLYAGTETGVFVSFDNGDNWQSLQNNLPVTPVHDLVVKSDDLIVATHGRSFWVLDDITPLRQLEPGIDVSQARLFNPKNTHRVRWGSNPQPGASAGSNPPSGVVLTYYLPKDVSSVTLEIRDSDGVTVGRVNEASNRSGCHRVNIPLLQYAGFRQVQGMIMWAAGPRPVPAPPGTYIARMQVGEEVMEQSFVLLKDPRSSSSEVDLRAQFELAMRIVRRVDDANDAVVAIRELKAKIAQVAGQAKTVAKEADDLLARLSGIEEEIYQVRNRSGQDPLNYPIKLNNRIAALIGVVLSGDFRPTDQCYAVYEELSAALDVQLRALQDLQEKDLAAFNVKLRALNLEPIVRGK